MPTFGSMVRRGGGGGLGGLYRFANILPFPAVLYCQPVFAFSAFLCNLFYVIFLCYIRGSFRQFVVTCPSPTRKESYFKEGLKETFKELSKEIKK